MEGKDVTPVVNLLELEKWLVVYDALAEKRGWAEVREGIAKLLVYVLHDIKLEAHAVKVDPATLRTAAEMRG